LPKEVKGLQAMKPFGKSTYGLNPSHLGKTLFYKISLGVEISNK